MTVNELIEKLKKCPGDMRVLTLGYEGWYSDIRMNFKSVVFDYNSKDTWYIGPHECAEYISHTHNRYLPATECVVIGRA